MTLAKAEVRYFGEFELAKVRSKEGFEGVLSELEQMMTALFLKRQSFDAMHLLFLTRHPQDANDTRPGLWAFQVDAEDENIAKDAAAQLSRQLCRSAGAVAHVIVSEAWMVDGADAEISAWRAKHGSIEHHPRRVENLIMLVEHAVFGARLLKAKIERPEGTAPQLGPWQHERDQRLEGRFVHLLLDPASLPS